MNSVIKKLPIDECYKLMHILEQRVDNSSWIKNIKSSLTQSGIYAYYDTITQAHESILIEKICDDTVHGYRISDGDDVSTPIASISLERSHEYCSPNRDMYDISTLPTMDETPLIGVNTRGFPVLCAGFKLENGNIYIFSPIMEDKEINQCDVKFYAVTESEREIMDILLGR